LPFFKFQGFQIFLLIFNIPILDKSAVEQILGNTNIDAKLFIYSEYKKKLISYIVTLKQIKLFYFVFISVSFVSFVGFVGVENHTRRM
jgi:hypothetical protein